MDETIVGTPHRGKGHHDHPARRKQREASNLAKIERYTRKELNRDIPDLTAKTMRYLLEEPGRYEQLLSETKLKDITVMLGILTDKMLLLEGQPTQIIGTPQQAQLDQIGTALQAALQQRGLAQTVTLTQQTAKIELKEPSEPRSPQSS